MNIVVCLKQTFDTEALVVLKDGKIDPTGVTLVINPDDEYAVEEGIRLKEKHGGEVVVVAIGNNRTPEAIRTALAMGADRAALIDDPALAEADDQSNVEALAQYISTLNYDIILTGIANVDTGSVQIAQRLAERLNLPCANMVTKLDIDETKATTLREIDGGKELLELPLPAVIAAQQGLNEPRYPSVPGIMKAKKKELKTFKLPDLGIDASSVGTQIQIEKITLPAARRAGYMIQGEPAEAAGELARILSAEKKVL